jgi:hypothetical protein
MAPWYRYTFLITWESQETLIEIRERTKERAVFMAGVTFMNMQDKDFEVDGMFSIKQIKPTT